MAFLNLEAAYKHGIAHNVEEQTIVSLEKRLEQEYSNLDFLNFDYMSELEKKIETASQIQERYKNMLVLGIGGSALGAKALQKAFFPFQDLPNYKEKSLYILDNINPKLMQAYLEKLNPKDTVVVVISKSGSTIETISQYFLAKKWLKDNLPAEYKEHMWIITDPVKGFLRNEVEKYGFFSFDVPPNLGGRFSVLSAVGLVPLNFLGLNWKELVKGAKSVANFGSLASHPAFLLAKWAFNLMQVKTELIFFNYLVGWDFLGDWFAQLWAESLGKDNKGSMPIPAVGVRDQHSLLQMFMQGQNNKGCLFLKFRKISSNIVLDFDLPEQWDFLQGKGLAEIFQAECLGTLMALSSRMPLVEIELEGPTELEAGKIIMLLEFATLLTGWLLQINPLNQPGVEKSKRLAKAKLGAKGFENENKELESFLSKKRSAKIYEF